MGALTLIKAGAIYLDTATVIYSVEKHAEYFLILRPLWLEVKANQVQVAASELTLLETLVLPMRLQDQLLIDAYEEILTQSELALVAISPDILRRAAKLRADFGLKTPDAIHAATAMAIGCVQFLTNDYSFQRIPQLHATVLQEFI